MVERESNNIIQYPVAIAVRLHLFPLSNDMLNLVPPFTAMDGLRIATWILFDTDILQFYISIPS